MKFQADIAADRRGTSTCVSTTVFQKPNHTYSTPILSLAIVFSQRINPNSTSHFFAAFDMSTSSSPSSFQVYSASALCDYEKLTGATLINHPLSAQLLACDSPSSLANLLRDQARMVSASLAGGESIGSSTPWSEGADGRPTSRMLILFPPSSALCGVGIAVLIAVCAFL